MFMHDQVEPEYTSQSINRTNGMMRVNSNLGIYGSYFFY